MKQSKSVGNAYFTGQSSFRAVMVVMATGEQIQTLNKHLFIHLLFLRLHQWNNWWLSCRFFVQNFNQKKVRRERPPLCRIFSAAWTFLKLKTNSQFSLIKSCWNWATTTNSSLMTKANGFRWAVNLSRHQLIKSSRQRMIYFKSKLNYYLIWYSKRLEHIYLHACVFYMFSIFLCVAKHVDFHACHTLLHYLLHTPLY